MTDGRDALRTANDAGDFGTSFGRGAGGANLGGGGAEIAREAGVLRLAGETEWLRFCRAYAQGISSDLHGPQAG